MTAPSPPPPADALPLPTHTSPRTYTRARRRPSRAANVRRTLTLSVLEGGLVQVFLNWTTGSVIIGYMLHLGASPTEIGLIASVPMLAQLVSSFAAYLGGLAGHLKVITALTALVGRGLWLLAAFLPLLGVPPEQRPAFVVLLVMVSSFFQAGAATLWTSWLGSVSPNRGAGAISGFAPESWGWWG